MSKCHIVGNHMPRLVTDAKCQEVSTLEIDVHHPEQEEDPHYCASKFFADYSLMMILIGKKNTEIN